MTAISAATAQAQLDRWVAASTKVAKGKSYQIGDRALTRADADEIREMIEYWEGKLAEANSSRRGPVLRGITPA